MQNLQQTIHIIPLENRPHFAAKEDHYLPHLLKDEELLSTLYA
jgi:hypothetical protein